MCDFQKYLSRMYVIDFLYRSTRPKSPSEIAKGSIYSKSKIEQVCHDIHKENIAEIKGSGYVSTKKAKKRIEDDIFDRIGHSYDLYLEKFAESGVVSIGGENTGESPYPLKSSIASEPENFRANYFGGVFIGEENDHFLTRDNTLPRITDLSFRNLERFPILLIKILWVAIHDENREYWEFTYEVFDVLQREYDQDFISIRSSIQMLFHIVLSSVDPPHTYYLQPDKSGEYHSRKVLDNTNFIAAFVAYPALESFIKFLCSSDIDMDGTVKQDQTIRDYSPRTDREFYSKGDRCSSLRDLLIHFEKEVADDQLQAQLEQMRVEISNLAEYPKSKIYGLIYQWRNTLSHEGTTDVKFGVLLNIICMLIWHSVNEKIKN